jgi:predicted ATPase
MPKDMMFCRLALKNWKNFADVDVDLQNRAFLVGPNASGKSNFLDAFRFLRDLASTGGGFQESIARRGGVKAIRCLAARRISDIEILIKVMDPDGALHWEYEIAFTEDEQHRPLLRKERVLCNEEMILERPNIKDRKDPERLTQTYLEQVNVNQRFRDLATFFGSIRYLHIVPQLVREPDRSVGRSNDPYGGDFLEQIAKSSVKTQTARLRRITKALRVAVPQLEEIKLHRDVRGRSHVRGKFKHWRPQGAWQTEEQFSDGTLRLMGLLWAALEVGGPLLLEEPELSLHPEIAQVLPQMFARVQRRTGRQFFISTHSLDLLRDEGIGLDEVLLFIPEAEGTTVTTAAHHRDIKHLLKGGLQLADVVGPKTRPRNVDQLTLFGDD